jgi:hypothetical protein
MTMQPASRGMPSGGGASGTGLADVIDTILDKGLVIDAFVRVSLVGIEVLTIDARVVVASVDTYLRFAEAANRLDLSATEKGLPEVIEGVTQAKVVDKARGAAKGTLEAAGEKLQEVLGGSADREEEPRRARRREDG